MGVGLALNCERLASLNKKRTRAEMKDQRKERSRWKSVHIRQVQQAMSDWLIWRENRKRIVGLFLNSSNVHRTCITCQAVLSAPRKWQ